MSKRIPEIPNAPGLTWRPRKGERWECRWQARSDLVRRGYIPKSARLFCGTMEDYADPVAVAFIQDRAQILQDEMLAWGRGAPDILSAAYDGTIRALCNVYQVDQDSPFRKLRYKSRQHYSHLMKRLIVAHGDDRVMDIKARMLLRWHEDWSAGGKLAMGHSMVTMLRTLMSFGTTMLEDDECARVSAVLRGLKFPNAKPRNERLTAEQANAIRAEAHRRGFHSIALAQALQFECMLRQKDVVGEWVPITEPGISDVTRGNHKWLRGLRWEEIDDTLVLRHVTSKRQKAVEIPLAGAPMVAEEFARLGGIPKAGPVIVDERSLTPWTIDQFRLQWRRCANAAGVPSTVRNMDSRAGAISEATDAGADLEHVRHAATHSDISMTQRYSRGAAEKTAKVLQMRSEFRKNKSGTDGA